MRAQKISKSVDICSARRVWFTVTPIVVFGLVRLCLAQILVQVSYTVSCCCGLLVAIASAAALLGYVSFDPNLGFICCYAMALITVTIYSVHLVDCVSSNRYNICHSTALICCFYTVVAALILSGHAQIFNLTLLLLYTDCGLFSMDIH